jgi:hypothetical protein
MIATTLLTVDQVPIDQLRPDPANPRRISDEELDALARSLRQFGFVQPILARKEDQTVIGGHQRLVAARRLGFTRTWPLAWPRPMGFRRQFPPDPEALSRRTTELVADLVEPAKADALEKLGESRQALGIASDWVRTKLAPKAISGGESVTVQEL